MIKRKIFVLVYLFIFSCKGTNNQEGNKKRNKKRNKKDTWDLSDKKLDKIITDLNKNKTGKKEPLSNPSPQTNKVDDSNSNDIDDKFENPAGNTPLTQKKLSAINKVGVNDDKEIKHTNDDKIIKDKNDKNEIKNKNNDKEKTLRSSVANAKTDKTHKNNKENKTLHLFTVPDVVTTTNKSRQINEISNHSSKKTTCRRSYNQISPNNNDGNKTIDKKNNSKQKYSSHNENTGHNSIVCDPALKPKNYKSLGFSQLLNLCIKNYEIEIIEELKKKYEEDENVINIIEEKLKTKLNQHNLNIPDEEIPYIYSAAKFITGDADKIKNIIKNIIEENCIKYMDEAIIKVAGMCKDYYLNIAGMEKNTLHKFINKYYHCCYAHILQKRFDKFYGHLEKNISLSSTQKKQKNRDPEIQKMMLKSKINVYLINFGLYINDKDKLITRLT